MSAISHMWREKSGWNYALTVTDDTVDAWLELYIDCKTEVVILHVQALPADFPHPEYGQ